MHVEGVMEIADREHVPLDDLAHLRPENRCVPDERATVDRPQVDVLREVDDELAVGRIVLAENRERAVQPTRALSSGPGMPSLSVLGPG